MNPLSDPPVIKICEWSPWGLRKLEFVFKNRIENKLRFSKTTLIFKLLFENELRFSKTNSNFRQQTSGGGGTPLYKPYTAVPPQRVGFLRFFGLKTGIDFCQGS